VTARAVLGISASDWYLNRGAGKKVVKSLRVLGNLFIPGNPSNWIYFLQKTRRENK
jgi:hypothetical protein